MPHARREALGGRVWPSPDRVPRDGHNHRAIALEREPHKAAGPTATLSFLDPNLSLTVVGWVRKAALIDIGLDLEFAPPWRRRRAA
jgi:hypothetical protein